MVPDPSRPDWPPSNEDNEPEWDDEWAEALLGMYAVAGVTYMECDGITIKSRTQYHGRIVKVDKNAGISVACEGVWSGKVISFPPDISAFEPAAPGKYVLKATQEAIDDPDVTASWTITEPQKS